MTSWLPITDEENGTHIAIITSGWNNMAKRPRSTERIVRPSLVDIVIFGKNKLNQDNAWRQKYNIKYDISELGLVIINYTKCFEKNMSL